MIQQREIKVSSRWGVINNNLLLTQDEAKGLVVFIPGRGYPVEAPLLYYLRQVALQAGLSCLSINFGYYGAGVDFEGQHLKDLIAETLRAIEEVGQPDAIVAKSMGTVIAGEICLAKNWQPKCMWLTPIAATVPFIKRLGGRVVFGSNDSLFTCETAQQLTGNEIQITEIKGSNHSLMAAGDWKTSLRSLEKVSTIGEEFFR